MSLYASIQDFELSGLPPAATATVAAQRQRHLQAASNIADSCGLRARYTLPLQALVGEVEHVLASGSTGTGVITAVVTPGSTITVAHGVQVEILTTGASGVATARVSVTSGQTWLSTITVTNGDAALGIGVTLTFSGGTWFDGDIYYVPVNYADLTEHIVAYATYTLLRRRGFNPEMDPGAYDALKTGYKDALKFWEDIKNNQVQLGLTDSTSGTEEGLFMFEPDLDAYEDADRDWTEVAGRTSGATAEGDW